MRPHQLHQGTLPRDAGPVRSEDGVNLVPESLAVVVLQQEHDQLAVKLSLVNDLAPIDNWPALASDHPLDAFVRQLHRVIFQRPNAHLHRLFEPGRAGRIVPKPAIMLLPVDFGDSRRP